MARTSDPHSASAQFFINTADNAFLNFRSKELYGKTVVQDWGYAVFGKVVDGFDVVDAIEGVSTKRHGYHDDVPSEPVVIIKAEAV
ncbi:cyclophilin type peptidyl-prolyl cis-trans isomerase/CLD family protein [Neisseria meningitidis NM151]|nr:cyclophilin type peptidyl-prolyl cis-trans isomerase/CLD family protein [Neisseria meningitidis NM151]